MISFNKGILELSHGDSRARASKFISALVGVKLDGSRLDRVDLEMALYKKTSVQCLVYGLDSLLKVDSMICSSSQHTQVSSFKFHVLSLLEFGFRFSV